jgi:hypothetical protein
MQESIKHMESQI